MSENFLMKQVRTKTKNPTRKGRGIGSGKGKTAGRGHKGQLARSGRAKTPFIATSDTPLQRRLPRRGFKPLNSKASIQMSLGEFLAMCAAAFEYTKKNNCDISIKTLSDIDHSFSGVKRVKIFLNGVFDLSEYNFLKGLKIGSGFFFTKSCKEMIVNLGFEF